MAPASPLAGAIEISFLLFLNKKQPENTVLLLYPALAEVREKVKQLISAPKNAKCFPACCRRHMSYIDNIAIKKLPLAKPGGAF